jgi:hydroxyethylthiazole kinase
MHEPPHPLPAQAADILARLREKRPRVHSITNAVAQNFTANVLLAFGAIPSMTISPDEIDGFAARSDALLVNLGTFDAERRVACGIAIDRAASDGKPWVLDPVLIDRSPPRADYARAMVGRAPSVVRLNELEFETLAGLKAEPRVLGRYAADAGLVVALTGAIDVVADGRRHIRVGNGHEWMALVTAMGCAGSAMIAACLAVEKDPALATATALLALGIAGELAADRASGPGSFAVDILDCLYDLDRAALIARAKVT